MDEDFVSFEELFEKKIYDPVVFEDSDNELFDKENPTNNFIMDLLKKKE